MFPIIIESLEKHYRIIHIVKIKVECNDAYTSGHVTQSKTF